MVTVAVRRVNILDKQKPILTDYINPKKIIYLPNTAGCFSSRRSSKNFKVSKRNGWMEVSKVRSFRR